jgi:hypothetical protein
LPSSVAGLPARRFRSSCLAFAWVSLYKTGAALSPAVPVPLAAQVQLTTADVLAGVPYPAAVHDLDCTGVDRFLASLTRRLAGCDKGSSAAFLQCETGTLPSKFVAHRRAVQYWLRVSHDACLVRPSAL